MTEPVKLGVYVDAMSLHAAARRVGPHHGFRQARPDYEAVLGECLRAASDFAPGFEITRQAIYVASPGSSAFKRALESIGFEVHHHTLREVSFCKSCGSPGDRWRWDATIAADMTEDTLGGRVQLVALASGNGVFGALLERVEQRGGVAFAASYRGAASPRLRRCVALSSRTLYEVAK